MHKYYTGIGKSRDVPDSMMEFTRDIAFKLKNDNWDLRSGNASGMDMAFWEGVERWYDSRVFLPPGGGPKPEEIYLPWDGFNDKWESESGFYVPKNPLKKDAEKIASEVHPAWHNCRGKAVKFHTRNVYQVLGQDLKTPSKFLICYAIPIKNGEAVKGGTNTAYQVVRRYNVPIFNLYLDEDCNRISNWTNS